MLKIYNTLSRKKEVFKPLRDKKVNLFVCGPTVYDFSHLGHARTYIAFDIISKYLRQKRYDVFYLQNITDIDDKIIARAKENKTNPLILAKNFEKEYLKDMKIIGVDSVTKYARATGYIKEIISQVERLLKKGFAYQIADGIYYDISKFKNYGKLSRRTVLGAENAVSRIDESKEKKNKGDFCLWKFSPSTGSGQAPSTSLKQAKLDEPKWKSPWGLGRPGWHIEDTAITEKFFGPQYDIHGGARDLIFPHHEAEISQMEAISGKSPLVKYWLHTGFLTIEGEKMAKSLGNFITIRDFLTGKKELFLKEHSGRFLRFLILKSHYRSPLDYSGELIAQAEKELNKIDEFLENTSEKMAEIKNINFVSKYRNLFYGAMDDDFNTPKAIASIFQLINEGNSLLWQDKLSKDDAMMARSFLKEANQVFGFMTFKKNLKEKIPGEVILLNKQREEFRKNGDYEDADRIREQIKQKGYWVEDTKEGSKIKKL